MLIKEIERVPEEYWEEFFQFTQSFVERMKQKPNKQDRVTGAFKDCPEIVDDIMESVTEFRKRNRISNV